MPKKVLKIDLNKAYLKKLYKEAKEKNEILWPDEAFNKLANFYVMVNKNEESSSKDDMPPIHRINIMSEAKRTHKFAVDLFYETYFPQKKGAPPMTDEHANFLLDLFEKGLSYREIAQQLEIPINSPEEAEKAKDIVRHRIKAAKRIMKK